MSASIQTGGVVDSQCHVSTVWYEPVEVLRAQMTRHDVTQAVLIQMLGQLDNEYQQGCVKRFPGVFASVVWVDPGDPDAVAQLHRLADDGAAGVRLRPTARSAGADPLAIWRCAAQRELTVSCVGNSVAFGNPEFSQVIDELPELNIVLEHLGGTSTPDSTEAQRAERLGVLQLARFANVYLKVPGLGELAARRLPPPAAGNPFDPGTPAVLEAAVAAFGPQRLLWGSDFPPVSSREGYGNALCLSRDALAHLPAADLQAIFAGVARRLFKLPA